MSDRPILAGVHAVFSSEMKYKIRQAVHQDAEGIIRAHRRSIREICSPDYTAAEIQVWSGRDFSESIWRDSMDSHEVEVIVDADEKIFGFSHHGRYGKDPSRYEIKGLYLCPEVTGLGFGKKLVAHAKTSALQSKCKEIILYSTTTARTFYEKQGFSAVSDMHLEIQGTMLPCIEMKLGMPAAGIEGRRDTDVGRERD